MNTDSYRIRRVNAKIKAAKARPIGGKSKHRQNRIVEAKSDIRPIVPAVQQAASASKPFPLFYPIKGTLPQCLTDDEVSGLHARWAESFKKKVGSAVEKRKLSEQTKATLEGILVKRGATSAPILINYNVCRTAFEMLRDGLVALASEHPDWQFVLVTIIDGRDGTSHTKTVINLADSQERAQRTLRKMSSNFFGVSEIALFNSHGHPDGGQHLQAHTHALVIGPNMLTIAEAVATDHMSRYEPNFSNAPVIDVRGVSSEPINLARIAAYLTKDPSKCMNWNPGKDGKPGHMNQSEKGDRFTRYLRLAMLRSMMTIEDVTFAGGAGRVIRSSMIKFVRALAVKDAAGKPLLHPDDIPSFYVDLCTELRLNWNLPIIRRSN